MRVAFISHYQNLYGANRSLLSLIDGLDQYGVVSHVIVPKPGPITTALSIRGIPTLVAPISPWAGEQKLSAGGNHKRFPAELIYPMHRRYRTIKRTFNNLRLLPLINRQIKSWDIDIVYTNSSIVPVGALAAQQRNKPHAWHLREFIDLHYGLSFDWGKLLTMHLINKADAKIAVSHAIREHYFGGDHSSVHVVYNGVASISDFEYFNSLSDLPSGLNRTGAYTFALVGFLHPSKGQVEAIKAMSLLHKRYPNVRLLIVGAGERSPLEELACDLGVREYIEFLGYLDDPFKVYTQADAVLMTSRYEAMGRVTVEAMAACRPVIGFDQGGTSELIEHGKTGLLYRNGEKELAECMIRLVTNPTWSQQLGKEGWKIAREKYTIEAYTRQVFDILTSII